MECEGGAQAAAALRDYRPRPKLLCERVGYLFNRNTDVREPFVQLYERDGGSPVTIPYARIATIRFTGRDTAAGNSYAAWLRSREAKGSPSASGA